MVPESKPYTWGNWIEFKVCCEEEDGGLAPFSLYGRRIGSPISYFSFPRVDISG
jgi:hypothetical protein